MKKILLYLFCAICLTTAASAQVTFSPAIFTAEDEVTLTVDVSGTPMAGQSEAYIWIFSNVAGGGRDGVVNGAWGNSGDGAKMTAAGPNKWSFKFIGTTLFNQTPGELKDFGFLVKARDGSKQTPDYKPFKFDPLIFTPTTFRVFPSKVGQEDAVTVNFDQSLATAVNEQRMTPTSVTIVVYSNNSAFGSPLTLPVRKLPGDIWAATFVPTLSFNIPAGTRLNKFTFKFNGTVLGQTGASTNVSSSETEVPFIELK